MDRLAKRPASSAWPWRPQSTQGDLVEALLAAAGRGVAAAVPTGARPPPAVRGASGLGIPVVEVHLSGVRHERWRHLGRAPVAAP
jgi:hypothetical protein